MRLFSAGELSRMAGTQESAMQDTCRLLDRSSAEDDYGLPVVSWEPVETSACGFDPDPGTEGMEQTEAEQMDGKLRLPLAIESNLEATSRIELTHRFGVALDPVPVFEVIGGPQRGPSGLVVDLKLVTEGETLG